MCWYLFENVIQWPERHIIQAVILDGYWYICTWRILLFTKLIFLVHKLLETNHEDGAKKVETVCFLRLMHVCRFHRMIVVDIGSLRQCKVATSGFVVSTQWRFSYLRCRSLNYSKLVRANGSWTVGNLFRVLWFGWISLSNHPIPLTVSFTIIGILLSSY